MDDHQKSKGDAIRGVLSAFPAELRSTLQLIEKNASNEFGLVLVQFVGAFAHPDLVCNLDMLAKLPKPMRQASAEFFRYCLEPGLTVDAQGALLAFVRPAMTPR